MDKMMSLLIVYTSSGYELYNAPVREYRARYIIRNWRKYFI